MTANAAAILIGASVSVIAGIAVFTFQFQVEQRSRARHDMAARLAEFSTAGWVVTLKLRDQAMATMASKSAFEVDQSDHIYRFLSAQAQIQLLDGQQVYDAAISVDRALTKLQGQGQRRVFTGDEWLEAGRPLTEAVLRFQRTARKALGADEIALSLPSGEAHHQARTQTG